MINNLFQYFKKEQQFYLESVKYERLEKSTQIGEEKSFRLNCLDDLHVNVDDKNIKLVVTRRLQFDPEGIFFLEVSFGAVLSFIPEKKHEVQWDEMDLEEEFRQQGAFVLGNLMNRISLLIGQLTSSFGQPPIITPPGMAIRQK